jgi:hypothetical protein
MAKSECLEALTGNLDATFLRVEATVEVDWHWDSAEFKLDQITDPKCNCHRSL